MDDIPNCEDVLLKNLLTNKKLLSTQSTHLTAPGENYGSSLLSVIFTLKNEETEKEEKLRAVAKLLPSNEFIRKFMNSSVTFRNELGFYQTILPTLKQNCTKSLDFFPEFYGGRSTDEHAIILLENLKDSGYTIGDRMVGFDLDTTELILTKMAELHGASLALKVNQPEVFEKLQPFFEEFTVFTTGEKVDFMTSDPMVNTMIQAAQSDEFCVPHLDKIRKTIENGRAAIGMPRNSPIFQKEKFATLIHNDLWVNNIMVKINNNKIVDVKFLDWQLYEHGSVVRDVLFFLFTSVQGHVLEASLDELISFYYQKLRLILIELNSDPNEFSYEVFNTEMKRVASQVAYYNIARASNVVFLTQEHVSQVEELSNTRFFDVLKIPSEICKKRICLLTREFIRKGWMG